ncbi:hypothetical protein D3C75_828430 [compost metagenome]
MLRKTRAVHQLFIPAVIHLRHSQTHHPPEQHIHRIHHLAAAAEIPGQIDAFPGTGGRPSRLVLPVFGQEQSGLRQPEAVDALLHVAYHKPVARQRTAD